MNLRDDFVLARVVKMKLLDHEAELPTVSEGNVGFDIRTLEDVSLEPGKVTKIRTGLALADNMGYSWSGDTVFGRHHKRTGIVPFFKIEGRSGLALKGIFPVGGIIDPSYRGEIGVLLFNSTDQPYFFSKKDRIAQLVCYHTLAPLDASQIVFLPVEDVTPSDRNDAGFGSTGL